MGKSVTNILMVGVGGQGIILASDILTRAAMEAGLDAKKSEIHGMSQRGGSVFSHIRFGKKVFSPLISEGEADILFSLEEMETLRWLAYARPESLVIVLKNRINPANLDRYTDGIERELVGTCQNIMFLDPEELRREVTHQKFLNVALLGALSAHIDLPEEAWRRAIEGEVPKGTAEQNWKAFLSGKSHSSR